MQADACALWVVHTHVVDVADFTPYLRITSADKRSGKSTLLEQLKLLVKDPLRTGGATVASLMRYIEAKAPTLLLDETDVSLRGPGSEALRGLLNEGFHRGGTFLRCKPDSFEPETFNVFCPKALAGIGGIPDTVVDRSITIKLRRRLPSEHVERFRLRDSEALCLPVREELAAWAAEAVDALAEARPIPPEDLHDRAADVWEPLFAIADLAAGSWPGRARQAALGLTAAAEEGESLGVQLLRDLHRIWPRCSDGLPVERVASNDLVPRLTQLEDAPWGSYDSAWGARFDPADLAKLVKPFGPSPKAMRVKGTGTRQGYEVAAFNDPWHRYGVVTGPNSSNGHSSAEVGVTDDVASVGSVDAVTGGHEEAGFDPPF